MYIKRKVRKNIKYNNKQNDDNQKKLQNYKELSTNFLLSQKDIKKGSVINNEKIRKRKNVNIKKKYVICKK